MNTLTKAALYDQVQQEKAELLELIGIIPVPTERTHLWHEVLAVAKQKYHRVKEVTAPFITPETAQAIANELGAASVAAAETPDLYDVFGRKPHHEEERVEAQELDRISMMETVKQLRERIAELELEGNARQNRLNKIRELLG